MQKNYTRGEKFSIALFLTLMTCAAIAIGSLTFVMLTNAFSLHIP